MKSNVVVTGAGGFVGSTLMKSLQGNPGWQAVPLKLSATAFAPATSYNPTGWQQALTGARAVVHLAARVHVMSDSTQDRLQEFRAINTRGTTNVASAAAAHGVKRFVYISSIKVNGEKSPLNRALAEQDVVDPSDPYAISKHEAEVGLRHIAAETGMEVVIIRPPLVYGPGVRANFAALMGAVQRSIPLPLGVVRNLRSLVAVDNLVDFIITCVDHPAAANQTFLVSDGEDLSTPELIRRLARAMGAPTRLISVPVPVLRWCGKLAGRSDAIERLCGNLQVDISKARDILGWSPPISVDEGLRRAVAGLGVP